jgi:hypothetical protein
MAVTFLPADNSYSSLYRLYSDNFDEDSDYNISLSTFHRVWKKYLPEIKFLTPRSDLCNLCKEMRFSSKYWAESEIEKKVNEWNYHINWANRERTFYK